MIRKFVRLLLGKDYWSFLSWYKDRFGIISAIAALVRLLWFRGVGVVPNPLTGGWVFIRPGTADQNVYEEVFLANEYNLSLGNVNFIVDAGAHIGLASTFLANKYPQAIIVALEPEVSNFEMLVKNTSQYSNIRPVRAGLWSERTTLCIQDRDVPTWSFRVSEDKSIDGIPAMGVQDILSEFNIEAIDILKMDIEGSELEVLNHSQEWMSAINNLIVELHDRFQPGCTEALAHAINGYRYDRFESGENVVIRGLQRAVLPG